MTAKRMGGSGVTVGIGVYVEVGVKLGVRLGVEINGSVDREKKVVDTKVGLGSIEVVDLESVAVKMASAFPQAAKDIALSNINNPRIHLTDLA